jgi:hypothetical protein
MICVIFTMRVKKVPLTLLAKRGGNRFRIMNFLTARRALKQLKI